MSIAAPLTRFVLASLSLAPLTSGCIFVDNGGAFEDPVSPFGDIAFDWSFAGETDCRAAGVDEVDIALFSGGVLQEEIVGEPCVGRGLVITELFEGPYDMVVDAYDRNGVLLYSGEAFVRVRGEEVSDLGVLELAAVDGQTPEDTGDLALFWSFLYPSDDTAETDCQMAGVEEVGLALTDLATDDLVYEDVRPCSEEGIWIAPLLEGSYALRLTATGAFGGSSVLLYDSGLLEVDVFAGELTDLGDVALGRVDESFADFDVSWKLVDAALAPVDCATAGVEDVVVTIQRAGMDVADDNVAVPCADGSVLRQIFVPGSYTVTVTAEGTDQTFSLSSTVDAAPGSVVELNLTLTSSTADEEEDTGSEGSSDAGTGSDGSPADDVGTDDAGTDDAGTDDAGTDDAGTDDAGTDDAGTDDAGTDDAGTDDAGTDDAGTDDAGTGDAGTGDAGTDDAGTDDVGADDAGTDDADTQMPPEPPPAP